MKQKERIIVFDGICGLCNKSIDLLMKVDRQKIFKYTSMQGEFVQTLDIETSVDSIIFCEEGILYYKSTAILKIFQSLGGLYRMTTIFYLIPKFIRDFIYDIVAKHYYKIFAKMEYCRVLGADEKVLFID